MSENDTVLIKFSVYGQDFEKSVPKAISIQNHIIRIL